LKQQPPPGRVLIAIEELIDANPWHGLRFGNLVPVEEAEIRRYRVGEFLYDVHLSNRRLEVQRDGKPLFSADAPVEIKQVRFNGKRVTGEVRTVKPVAFTIGVGQPRKLESGSSKFEGFTR
jgi:hypothetical protein